MASGRAKQAIATHVDAHMAAVTEDYWSSGLYLPCYIAYAAANFVLWVTILWFKPSLLELPRSKLLIIIIQQV